MRNRISDSLKSAMREKQTRRISTLRLINAAIGDRDIALRGKGKDKADDEEILDILAKMVKQREESSKMYRDGGREELAQAEADRQRQQQEERFREQRRRTAFAQEASARRTPLDEVEVLGTNPQAFSFDPVINRAIIDGPTDQERMLELKRAYEQTGLRTYIKQLRKLRRLR